MHKEVIVIGAGIAGIGAAYYLNKAGMAVTVLDKGDGYDNCSYGNAGMVVPSHIIPLASPDMFKKGLKWMFKSESPFYIRPRFNKDLFKWGWRFKKAATKEHVEESSPLLRDLLMTNRELLIELEREESLEFAFQKNGLFMLCKTEKGLEEEAEIAEKANALGIPAKVLSAKETCTMEPNIKMDIIGATYFPKDAHFHPGALMDQLKSLLKKRGVVFEFNKKVTGFVENSGVVSGVMLGDGSVMKTSKVIICTGAWTSSLTKSVGFSMPMEAGKGYSITLDKKGRLPNICALLSEAKVSMTPMPGKLRFGGTMEIAMTDKNINPVKFNVFKKSIGQYFPEYSLKNLNGASVWVGLRPLSPDGLPYVGAINKYKNVYVSTGHAMMGMSLGLVTGNIVTKLITKGGAQLAHRLISPNRYAV